MCLGFTLASFSSSIWQLLLTQGFLVGLGMSLFYFPLLAPAPEYFTNHRATAMGFVSDPCIFSCKDTNICCLETAHSFSRQLSFF